MPASMPRWLCAPNTVSNSDEIDFATLGIPQSGMLLIGEPPDAKANPTGIVDGQFSGPFLVAVALSTGAMDWNSYALLHNAALHRLMARVSCVRDTEIETRFPGKMCGRLQIRTHGRVLERLVIEPKGEPSNFLSEGELRAKFDGLVEPILGREQAEALADAVLRLQTLPKATAVMELSRPS